MNQQKQKIQPKQSTNEASKGQGELFGGWNCDELSDMDLIAVAGGVFADAQSEANKDAENARLQAQIDASVGL
ncbi:MAG: hypothetical protein KME49_05305 [Brasilonema octagenarum HA4186-MV1]|jgi:hypothetical protein|nr:hypothetical protein [Brasilonema octagenarum HA4186-MV1]